MKTIFLDTHIFLCYLTDSEPDRADQLDALLDQAASGEVRLVTSEVVLAELVRVLEVVFSLGKQEVASKIQAILGTPGLSVLSMADLDRVLEVYAGQDLDFVDALTAGIMDKQGMEWEYFRG